MGVVASQPRGEMSKEPSFVPRPQSHRGGALINVHSALPPLHFHTRIRFRVVYSLSLWKRFLHMNDILNLLQKSLSILLTLLTKYGVREQVINYVL